MSEDRDEAIGAFLRAVGDGEIDRVRAALASAPELVDAVGPHPYWGGRPQALHVAVETKQPEMAALLLDAGADPSGRNEAYAYWSPLMLACARRRPDLAELLLARGARIGLPEALLLGMDKRVEGLLGPGLPESRWGPLLSLARTPSALDLLLDRGADPMERDEWGATPVDALANLGAEGRPLIRRLLARGVPVEARHLARIGDRAALAARIEAAPAAAHDPAVLLAAVDAGDPALVRFLLGEGADANARAPDRSRQTALHNAAWNGDLLMVRLLVEAGADLAALDEQYRAPPWGWATTAITVTNNPDCRAVADWLAANGRPAS
ncbi:MAG: ankyrin repeat domain-containing protein [Sphingomonadaceae bacterium]|nr:ankyrin repeat domain-containing protein [Sphingomonadaceae bacterium]